MTCYQETKSTPNFPGFRDSGQTERKIAVSINVTHDAAENYHCRDLWSSKSLHLLWLPRRTDQHIPSLLSAASPEAVPVYPNQFPESDRELRWYWRVDRPFGAWVDRAIRRASSTGVYVDNRESVDFISQYLFDLYSTSSVTNSLVQAEVVTLPGAELLAFAAQLTKYGMLPQWSGWKKYLADSRPEPSQVPASRQENTGPAPTKRRTTKAKSLGKTLWV